MIRHCILAVGIHRTPIEGKVHFGQALRPEAADIDRFMRALTQRICHEQWPLRALHLRSNIVSKVARVLLKGVWTKLAHHRSSIRHRIAELDRLSVLATWQRKHRTEVIVIGPKLMVDAEAVVVAGCRQELLLLVDRLVLRWRQALPRIVPARLHLRRVDEAFGDVHRILVELPAVRHAR